VRNGKVLVHCRAGCAQPVVIDDLRQRGLWPTASGSGAGSHGLTIEQLANAKQLPTELLKKEFGLREHSPSIGHTEVVIPYRDPDGKAIEYRGPDGVTRPVVRYRKALEGSQRFSWPKGVQAKGLVYGLERLESARNAGWVLIVEGESDVWTAAMYGIPAIGIPGKTLWSSDFAPALRGLQVYIWQEPSAEDFVQRIVRDIPTCRVIVAPDGVKDLNEAHQQGIDLRAAIEEWKKSAIAPPKPPLAPAGSRGAGAKGGDTPAPRRESLATALVRLAHEAGIELFHTPDDEPFATVVIDDHAETWALSSKRARQWLAKAAYDALGRTPGGQALQDAIETLAGEARFAGVERGVHVRLAAHGDDAFYLDLADASWRVVEITAAGWRLVPAREAPVRFRRPAGLLALPEPTRGGSIGELRQFVNVATDDDWRLVVAWVLGALNPQAPCPILVLHGDAGRAKTTTMRVLRQLVDPNKVPERAEPQNLADLVIAAHNTWIQSYDNLSHLPRWLSDALCRLATGGGLAKRQLYTDSDETLLKARRPIAINGIEEFETHGDLLDRAILLYLPEIDEARRVPERLFWQRFHAAQPRILGALLDAVATGLANRDRVHLSRRPRLADFAEWVTACEPALGWPAGAFLATYDVNRESAHELALEASPVAEPLRAFLRDHGGAWTGTATELFDALTRQILDRDGGGRPPRGWPGNARALSNALRRIEQNLRAVGIDVTFARTAGRGSKRLITIAFVEPGRPPLPPTPGERKQEQLGEFASPASPASQQVQVCDANRPGATQPGSRCDASSLAAQIESDARDASDANSASDSEQKKTADGWGGQVSQVFPTIDTAGEGCVERGCSRTLFRFTPEGAGVCMGHAVLDAARRRDWPRYLAGGVRVVQGPAGWRAFVATATHDALWEALAALE
jgi:uncharacterized protein YukE